MPGVLAEKAAAPHPALAALLEAKAHSDARRWALKHAVLRRLIAQAPADFVQDSDLGTGIVGVTHVPTGFRVHLPGRALPVPLAAPVKAAEALLAAVEKAAVLGALGRAAAPALKPLAAVAKPVAGATATVARAAVPAAKATLQTGVQAAQAGARAVGSAAAAVPAATQTAARATGSYAKAIAGYGPGGPLEGQRLFSAASVKPRLTPAAYRTQTAAGATPEQLAATHQLPSLAERWVPGMGRLGQLGNRLNRNPLLHPLVQSWNTVSNVLNTPLTRPLTTPAANYLSTAGAANVARGGGRALLGRAQQAGGAALTGADAAMGTVARAAGAASLGLGTYGAVDHLRNRPWQAAYDLLRAVGVPHEQAIRNGEVYRLYKNPVPALWAAATDPSDVGRLSRDVGREMLPYAIQNNAHRTLEHMDADPTTRTINRLRLPTLAGLAARPALAAVADPTPPPTEAIVADQLARHLPDIARRPLQNATSPTGRHLASLLVDDPRVRARLDAAFSEPEGGQ